MSTVSVAVTQMELRRERTFHEFEEHVTELARAAARGGADIVLLPELVTTGLLASHPDAEQLTVADLDDAYRSVFPSHTSRFLDALARVAADLGVVIVGSHFRKTSTGTHRNTAYVVHPDGRVEQQDKLHLIPQERGLGTEAGDDVLITVIKGMRTAVQICADIEFPEVSRYLAKRGVDLILVPSLTWNRRGAQRVRYGAHARAMENQLYVAVSTLIGSSGLPRDGAMYGTGYAFVAMPLERRFGDNTGTSAAHDDDGTEGFVIAELDSAILEEARAHPEPPGFRYRRDDLYARLDAEGV